MTWTDLSHPAYGQIVGCCERGNKLSVSVKFGKFLG